MVSTVLERPKTPISPACFQKRESAPQIEAPRLAATVPADGLLERGLAGECSPGGFGQDPDAIGQAHGGDHTAYRFNRGFVELIRRAALDRTLNHGSVDHPRYLQIDRIGGRAVDFVRQLDSHHVLAN